MRCFAADTKGCLDLRCCAFALDGQVSTEWSRCPGSMAWRARDNVLCGSRATKLSRLVASRIGRLSDGVGQGCANCGPRAKCDPRTEIVRPANRNCAARRELWILNRVRLVNV